jgi:hypothetical protein
MGIRWWTEFVRSGHPERASAKRGDELSSRASEREARRRGIYFLLRGAIHTAARLEHRRTLPDGSSRRVWRQNADDIVAQRARSFSWEQTLGRLHMTSRASVRKKRFGSLRLFTPGPQRSTRVGPRRVSACLRSRQSGFVLQCSGCAAGSKFKDGREQISRRRDRCRLFHYQFKRMPPSASILAIEVSP